MRRSGRTSITTSVIRPSTPTTSAPVLLRRLVEQYVRRPPPGSGKPGRLAVLTERTLDVLRLIASGGSNAEIAAQLFLG